MSGLLHIYNNPAKQVLFGNHDTLSERESSFLLQLVSKQILVVFTSSREWCLVPRSLQQPCRYPTLAYAALAETVMDTLQISYFMLQYNDETWPRAAE